MTKSKTVKQYKIYAQPLGEDDKRKCVIETDDYYWLLENMWDIAWKIYKDSFKESNNLIAVFNLVEVYEDGSENYFKALVITAVEN